jgi:hypothetical protein
MAKGQHRMPKQHSWSRVSHQFLDSLALFRAVAVHLTQVAGGLSLLKRANLKALKGIREQILAIATKSSTRAMMISTV